MTSNPATHDTSTEAAHILIVDDEPMVREVLTHYLDHAGFTVTDAADGPTGLRLARELDPDLVLLDLMLPGLHGIEVLRGIRELGSAPVILLSAMGEERDRVNGLEVGADDYVVKPFSPREVVARVRSVLRRVPPSAEQGSVDPIGFGEVTIDPARREVSRLGNPVELTRLEFELLLYLARHPGQVHERSDLLRAVWGSSDEWQDPSTVTVHIRRLRKKIENDPSEPVHLVTVYGIGYRFDL